MLFAVAAAAFSALTSATPKRLSPRKTIPPNTLVCVFRASDSTGQIDPILPIGGMRNGKWLQGDTWRHRLPKTSVFAIYSLTRGEIGSLRISGFSHDFPRPVDWVWHGRIHQNTKGDLSELVVTGYLDSRVGPRDQEVKTGDIAVAIWRTKGIPVRWIKAHPLELDNLQYRLIAYDYFISRGLEKYVADHKLPKQISNRVKTDQLISVDIDGDGKNEVIMSADWSEMNDPAITTGTAGVGDWICLLLIKPDTKGKPIITTISHEQDDFGAPAEEVLGCADIDSDGKTEVITRYFSGNPDSFRIYKMNPVRRVADFSFLYGE